MPRDGVSETAYRESCDMHLTCCEIARNKLEHPSHDWHVQPIVKDQNAYPHWVECSSPVATEAATSPRTCSAPRFQLDVFTERAQSACPLCCSRKTAQTSRELIEFSKDRLEV